MLFVYKSQHQHTASQMEHIEEIVKEIKRI